MHNDYSLADIDPYFVFKFTISQLFTLVQVDELFLAPTVCEPVKNKALGLSTGKDVLPSNLCQTPQI